MNLIRALSPHSILLMLCVYCSGCSLVIDVGDQPTAPSDSSSCVSHDQCAEGERCREGECVATGDECDILAGSEWEERCREPECESDEMPQDEVCDAIDNDCDGEVDEEVFLRGEACIPDDVALNIMGVYDCVEGQLICLTDGIVEPQDEVCDAMDNDQDGAVDEGVDEALPERTCPPESCRETSAQRCVDGALIDDCDAPLFPDSADDTCDEIDDDCDGVFSEGVMARDEVCGEGCAVSASHYCVGTEWMNDCAEVLGAISDLCDGVDEDCDGSVDEDGLSSVELCLDDTLALSVRGTRCEEGARAELICDASQLLCADQSLLIPEECDCADFDLPDLEAIDADCDGVDGASARSIFVHPIFGDDTQSGTERAPLQTLDAALALYASRAALHPEEPRAPILLGVGEYQLSASLEVTDDLTLVGGYEVEMTNGALLWSRRSLEERQAMSVEPTVISSLESGPLFRVQDPSVALSLQSLTIVASNGVGSEGEAQRSSRGLMLLECELAQLLDVTIRAGDGSVGTPGASASPLSLSTDRLRGADAMTSEGASGGVNMDCCPSGECRGGDGGAVSRNGAGGVPSELGPLPGYGQGGQYPMFVEGRISPAMSGRIGLQGDDATPHALFGQLDVMSGDWSALKSGEEATSGEHGGGGGGGAGLDPEQLVNDFNLGDDDVGGGGGGGAGGCGGAPGERGGPGGWSVGVVIGELCAVTTEAPIIERGLGESDAPRLSAPLTIELGVGGEGGRAGVGGVGEQGGEGGQSIPNATFNQGLSLHHGAAGGPGGCGGHGVGGNGGSAVGVIYIGDRQSGLQVQISGGQAGVGGASLTNSVCDREEGPNGFSGLVMDDLCCLRGSLDETTAPCGPCP